MKTSLPTNDAELEESATKPAPERGSVVLYLILVLLASSHGYAIWTSLEGWRGLNNGWPLWRDDHSLYLHSALVTRSFLSQNGTTAGYDPTFMSGYAKSVVFPASSTLPELVMAAFGHSRPERVYKIYVLLSAAAIPWLVAIAGRLWRLGSLGCLISVALFLLYVWTDFPINYAAFGMLPYLLAIPLGLVATGAFMRYAESGGWGWWLISAGLMALVVLVHFTSALIVAPAAAVTYLSSAWNAKREGQPFSRSRHLGVWLIPLIVLAANAFWWAPGLWLTATKGASDFAFAHPEGVLKRLVQIATTEAAVEPVLIVLGLLGITFFFGSKITSAAALLTFVGTGFCWGYLAGGVRSLDFLQPGRHTFAFFTGLSVAAGYGLERVLAFLRGWSRYRFDIPLLLGFLGVGAWFFGPSIWFSVEARVTGPIPFLSSRPSPRMLWVISRVKRFVSPDERLLYEEGGFGLPGIPDPFQGGRLSGLLPEKLGIELIGGPYLHAALTTNFTQFGEGKLFGKSEWDRDWFVRYAKLYRPAAILCWTPHARQFCKANPDLIEIKDDDGTLMIGRVVGFLGTTIEGKAEVLATHGRLRVVNAEAGLDGSVVLRYHSVPCLRTDPPVDWEPVFLERDPVPFIKMKPTRGPVTFEMGFPPGTSGKPNR